MLPPLDSAFVFGLLFISFGSGLMEAHDAPYWPAAWTAWQSPHRHPPSWVFAALHFVRPGRQPAGRLMGAIRSLSLVGVAPDRDPAQTRTWLQGFSDSSSNSSSNSDTNSNMVAFALTILKNTSWHHYGKSLLFLLLLLLFAVCLPGMRFGQKAKGRSTANCCGILICIVKSSANPAHFAELSA